MTVNPSGSSFGSEDLRDCRRRPLARALGPQGQRREPARRGSFPPKYLVPVKLPTFGPRSKKRLEISHQLGRFNTDLFSQGIEKPSEQHRTPWRSPRSDQKGACRIVFVFGAVSEMVEQVEVSVLEVYLYMAILLYESLGWHRTNFVKHLK